MGKPVTSREALLPHPLLNPTALPNTEIQRFGAHTLM